MDSNKILIANEKGEEKEFDILFTFENEEKSYVLYYDASEEEPMVYASIYDEEGHLFDIESAEEWDLINDVFESFMGEEDEEDVEQEEEHCCKHHSDKKHECCGKHHHEDGHECCGKHHHEGDHECCSNHH